MNLQRKDGLEFATLHGVLKPTGSPGYKFYFIDQEHHVFRIENERTDWRMDDIVGQPIQIKGLIDRRGSSHPKIHVIGYQSESLRGKLFNPAKLRVSTELCTGLKWA